MPGPKSEVSSLIVRLVQSQLSSLDQSSSWFFLFWRSALAALRWVLCQDTIKDLFAQRSGGIRDLIKRLGHCDRLQLHQGRNLAIERQFTEFLAQVARLLLARAGRFRFCLHRYSLLP